MYYDLKTGNIIKEDESKSLSFLYNTIFGRMLLKILTLKFISKIYGIYQNSFLSKYKIKKFIKNNNIDMSEYKEKNYKSFNDFFMREIKDDKRNIEGKLFSVCDSKLSVYEINENQTFKIKNSKYTIDELVGTKVSDKYKYALIFRLCVDDYHHYVFPDNGYIKNVKFIDGKLHTVRPIAFKKNKVFIENSRCVTELECKNLGNVIYIEVGALFVGKIVNRNVKTFKSGEEKGHFEFGGSTIVMLIEDKIKLNELFIENTKKEIETIVKLGNKLD